MRLIKGRDSGQTLASSQCPLLAASVLAEALGALRLGEMFLKRFKNVSKNVSALVQAKAQALDERWCGG